MIRRVTADPLVPLIGVAVMLALWYLAVKTRVIDPVLLPLPTDTARAAWKGFNGKLGLDFLITLERTALAIALASAIGIPIGLILGASEKLYRSLEFVVDFFRSTPATAIFPLFLLLFGVDDKTKVYVATFAASLAIIFNVAYGVMNARKTRLLAAFLMGARRHQILLVILLESFPQTFIGLRTGVSLALIVVIVAEMFIGSKDGLGNSIFEAQQLFEMPAMYAAIFASGALGYGLNLLFRLIEKRVVHWAGK
ncbi:MAG: ABC transporter permease [Alphaproteobacteria bacterium]|nr:ABC transporter permease [Alphaproteobacteria bacterium]